MEVEVFRLTPIVGKYYEKTTYTRKTGNFPNEKYYSTNELKYVGKFIKLEGFGERDGRFYYAIFEMDREIINVSFDYEGTVCFREVEKK